MTLRHDANRFGGHVIETQVTLTVGEQLANDFNQEILVKTDLIASAEGPIELCAHRERDKFGPILITTSTSSARGDRRLTTGQIRRPAADVRAKLEARAPSIDEAARKVIVTAYRRGASFDIHVMVGYR